MLRLHTACGRDESTHAKAEEVVEAILREIKNVLRYGDSVILRRFDSFQVRNKASITEKTVILRLSQR